MDFPIITATTTATSTLYSLTDQAKDYLNFQTQFQLGMFALVIFFEIVLIVVLFWRE